jgi:hypothetical protein
MAFCDTFILSFFFLFFFLLVGNKRFKVCINNFLETYMKASSRSEKSAVISSIVTSIRESSANGGGFVRWDPASQGWYEVGDKVARDKVGQCLRDAIQLNEAIKLKRGGSVSEESNLVLGLSPKRKSSASISIRSTKSCSPENLSIKIGNEENCRSYLQSLSTDKKDWSMIIPMDDLIDNGFKMSIDMDIGNSPAGEECIFKVRDWNQAEDLCNWFEADQKTDDLQLLM